MLAAPNVRRPSRLPTVLMALAVASAVSYFAFFRHKADHGVAAPPAAPAPVAAATRVEPPAPIEAPKPERAPEPPKKELRKAAASPPVPVAYTPPPRSVKTEIDELIADGKWRDARAKVA